MLDPSLFLGRDTEMRHMGFVFFLRMFQDKCNSDCNRDYLQCHRSRLLTM